MLRSSHDLDRQTHPFTLQIHPVVQMDDDQLFEFCRRNRDLRVERTPQGDLILRSPVSSESGRINAQLTRLVGNWAEEDGSGIVFDSSSGFTLPNRAMRAPDVAWIQRERWQALTPAERQRFAPICPDFVIELRSPSDALKLLQEKMQEYIDHGARLGWLIDPQSRRVYLYRPTVEVEVLQDPERLSGDPVLSGFTLELQQIWRS